MNIQQVDAAIKSSTAVYIPKSIVWDMDRLAYAAKRLSTRGMILYMRLVKEQPGSTIDISYKTLAAQMSITTDEWYDGFKDLMYCQIIAADKYGRLSLRTNPERAVRNEAAARKASSPRGASARCAAQNTTPQNTDKKIQTPDQLEA